MNKVKDRFVCWIPCKPYVKRFLVNNFNAPDDSWSEILDLSSDNELHADFVGRLSRHDGRYDTKYRDLYRYTELVPVEIKQDEFYRYGWSLSNTDAVNFGLKVERRIKLMLFLYLDTQVAFGIPLSTAIRNFQQTFSYDEDCWPYDSIRREYNRHGYKKSMGKINVFDFINKIIMEKLSAFGTISQTGKKTYENNIARR